MPYPNSPYKQNDLFTGGDNCYLNACVGTNGGPYGLDTYARGYFRAGILLSDSIIKDPTSIDSLIYPLINTFRHGIELYLKYLVEILSCIYNLPMTPEGTHLLIDNWRKLQEKLQVHSNFDIPNSSIQTVEKILMDFIEIDPTGQAFRYPHERSGNKFLQKTSLINVEVVKNTMNFLFDFFHTIDEQAQIIWDEILYEQ